MTKNDKSIEFAKLGAIYYPNIKNASIKVNGQAIFLTANRADKGGSKVPNYDNKELIQIKFTSELKMIEAAQYMRYYQKLGLCPFDKRTIINNKCPFSSTHNHKQVKGGI